LPNEARGIVELRDVYAVKALSQISRLLGLQDRNSFSPTYGCFHRDYWLYKTSDFPDAVRQFGVHALALVYKHSFPGSIYKGNQMVRDWAVAGLDFWANIQHKDGSFDEFYPYERGWVGPTAFTTFTCIEAYRLLKDEIPEDVSTKITSAIRRAAYFIAGGESERDDLANHHAMACLVLWKAYELLADDNLRIGFEKAWEKFLSYHNSEEGWSREYDGIDPGYLSATVSFLSKIYQTNPDPEILGVLRQSVKFCSFFLYPDGFYGGSLGSRNTLHFYPHGFEILAGEIPLAASVAEAGLKSLAEGKLVPPEIMSDRYVFYRVPEFLQSYLDYSPRAAELPPLPCEEDSLVRYFPGAGISVAARGKTYVAANLSKGGVVKIFDRSRGEIVVNDCGVIGRLSDGRVVTSQWIDADHLRSADGMNWEVTGHMNEVPSNKLLTPLKNIIFRTTLVVLGWNPRFAHMLKGRIRSALILGCRRAPVRFRRSLSVDDDGKITLKNELSLEGNAHFQTLSVGGEFSVRYVPQSRYFQMQELFSSNRALSREEIIMFNKDKKVEVSCVLVPDAALQWSVE